MKFNEVHATITFIFCIELMNLSVFVLIIEKFVFYNEYIKHEPDVRFQISKTSFWF